MIMTNSFDETSISSGGYLYVNNGHNDNRHYTGYFILASPGSGNVAPADKKEDEPSNEALWIYLVAKTIGAILLCFVCGCSVGISMKRRRRLEQRNL